MAQVTFCIWFALNLTSTPARRNALVRPIWKRPASTCFAVWGVRGLELGFRVQRSGFQVEGLGVRVYAAGGRVWGVGFRVCR